MTLWGATDDSWERRWSISAWEFHKMTICIAAICELGNAIVTASDRELGVGFTSAEFEDAKIMPLFKGANPGHWVIAISGTVSHATEVLGAVRLMESELESREWYEIQSILQKAYRKVRLSKAEGEILAARGWTLEKFISEGAKLLPPTTYANMDTRLALYDLEASLILAGYGGVGAEGYASILTVRNPGIVTDHTKLGFWCIGSGSTLAQTSMFNRDYSWSFSVEKAAYMVYEAKRNAERATGVGTKETDIAVITPKGAGRIVPKDVEGLKSIYDEIKPKEFSDKHDKHLKGLDAFKHIRKSM
jgi:hypothetical protein